VRVLATLAVFLVFAAPAAAKLPSLPHGWPKTMQIGLSDAPGGAAALRASAPFGFRYQYLAGGVNTGQGWSTWNPDGTFASMYVQDSWSHGTIPVLTYYMLLQSNPKGGDEAQVDLAHLRDPQVMAAYWQDVRCCSSGCTGRSPSWCTSSPTSGATSSRPERSRSARRSPSSGSAFATRSRRT
jgi:hypothetical protein